MFWNVIEPVGGVVIKVKTCFRVRTAVPTRAGRFSNLVLGFSLPNGRFYARDVKGC